MTYMSICDFLHQRGKLNVSITSLQHVNPFLMKSAQVLSNELFALGLAIPRLAFHDLQRAVTQKQSPERGDLVHSFPQSPFEHVIRFREAFWERHVFTFRMEKSHSSYTDVKLSCDSMACFAVLDVNLTRFLSLERGPGMLHIEKHLDHVINVSNSHPLTLHSSTEPWMQVWVTKVTALLGLITLSSDLKPLWKQAVRSGTNVVSDWPQLWKPTPWTGTEQRNIGGRKKERSRIIKYMETFLCLWFDLWGCWVCTTSLTDHSSISVPVFCPFLSLVYRGGENCRQK